MPAGFLDLDRELIKVADEEELDQLPHVVRDVRRRRPAWFDGRFLAARDLRGEQNYFLGRIAELSRALGSGVVEGLDVEMGSRPDRLLIESGHGVAFSGEHVFLRQDLGISVSDIEVQQALNAALGLARRPAPSSRYRSGLFVLALRAVEYTANPIASYPTHIDEDRSLQHGDMVEATAITLVPYDFGTPGKDEYQTRALLARDIFLKQSIPDLPASALPLAMISLDRGRVQWIDTHLVRRELQAARSDILGRSTGVDQLRTAQFRQQTELTLQLTKERGKNRGSDRFAAMEYFRTLAAAGALPTASVDPASQSQNFFPPGMRVEIAPVPEDELELVLNDALNQAPLDLENLADLDQVSVLVMVPVPRTRFNALIPQLSRLSVSLNASSANLKLSALSLSKGKAFLGPNSAFTGSISGRLKPPSISAISTSRTSGGQVLQQAMKDAKGLWYVLRRRNSYSTDTAAMLRSLNINTEKPKPGGGGEIIVDPTDGPPPTGPTEPVVEPPPTTTDPQVVRLEKLIESGLIRKVQQTPVKKMFDIAETEGVRSVFLDVFEAQNGVANTVVGTLSAAFRLSVASGNAANTKIAILNDFKNVNLTGYALLDHALFANSNISDWEEALNFLKPVLSFEKLTEVAEKLAKIDSELAKGQMEKLHGFLKQEKPDQAVELLNGLLNDVQTSVFSDIPHFVTKARVEKLLSNIPQNLHADLAANFKRTNVLSSRFAAAIAIERLLGLRNPNAISIKENFKDFKTVSVANVAKFESAILDHDINGNRLNLFRLDQISRNRMQLLVVSKVVEALAGQAQKLDTDVRRLKAASILIQVLDSSNPKVALIQRAVEKTNVFAERG